MKVKTTIQKAKVISNPRIKNKYFKIIIDSPKIAKDSKPGQFLNIKVNDGYEPFLRRPFSIHRISHKSGVRSHRSKIKKACELIEILYEVVGKGTEILSQKKTGEYLDIIGPLGKGFDYKSCVAGRALQVLVAGGIGAAPLVFLAEKLDELATRYSLLATLVLIGARTKSQLLCEKEFKDLGCEVKISTDDGSKGFKGKVTDLLRDFLQANRQTGNEANYIYACGPRPMLKEIAKISKQYNIPAQISLEEHMACGIGACLGCVINTKDGYQRVCKEGPVFKADEILWE